MLGVFALLLVLPAQESVEDLVKRLADDLPETRDRAARALFEAGEAALPALRKAAEHPDPEARARAGDVARRIELALAIPPHLLARYPAVKRRFETGDVRGLLEFGERHPAWGQGFKLQFEALAVRLLDHPDPEVKKKASAALDRSGTPFEPAPRRCVAELAREIARWDPEASDDPERVWLWELGTLAAGLVTPQDREILDAARAKHADGERVLEVLRGGTGVASAVPALLETLRSGPAWARAPALRIVARTRLAPAGPAVLALVDDPQVGYLAHRAMTELRDPAFGPALLDRARRKGPSTSWMEMDLLLRARPPGTAEFLLETLRGPDPSARTRVAESAQRTGFKDVFDSLLEKLRETEGSVYARAAASVSDGGTIGRLLRVLDRPEPERGHLSPWDFQWVRDPGAQREVVKRFGSEKDREKRRGLLHSLTNYSFLAAGGPGVEEALEGVLRNPQDELAVPAAAHLLRMKGAEAVGAAEEVALAAGLPRALVERLAWMPSRRLSGAAARLALEEKAEEAHFLYLENAGARAELEEILAKSPSPHVRQRAAAGLLMAGGGDAKLLERLANEIYLEHLADLAQAGVPGAREVLVRRVRRQAPEGFELVPLIRWGDPDMVPALKEAWDAYVRERRIPEPAEEVPEFSAVLRRNSGHDALRALAATGDRGLIPFFLERLGDPEYGVQLFAAEGLGRLGAKEAVPALRRLVHSGSPSMRAAALHALSRIGAPGTAEFVRAHLRDNPHAAPQALARLGVNARREVGALLAEGERHVTILGALDLMAHPDVYAGLDLRLPPRVSPFLADLPALVTKVTGRRCRLTAAARLRARAGYEYLGSYRPGTLREVFEDLQEREGYTGGSLTHLYRDGVIELCTAEDAEAFWRERLK